MLFIVGFSRYGAHPFRRSEEYERIAHSWPIIFCDGNGVFWAPVCDLRGSADGPCAGASVDAWKPGCGVAGRCGVSCGRLEYRCWHDGAMGFANAGSGDFAVRARLQSAATSGTAAQSGAVDGPL